MELFTNTTLILFGDLQFNFQMLYFSFYLCITEKPHTHKGHRDKHNTALHSLMNSWTLLFWGSESAMDFLSRLRSSLSLAFSISSS